MAKMKIFELAKEVEKSNKEIIDFLNSKNVEVKSHMAALEDEQVQMVKNAFAKDKAADKQGALKEKVTDKAEAPKKKNIVHVFRPQNTQAGARNGGRRQGQPTGNRQGRPMAANNGRPARNQNGNRDRSNAPRREEQADQPYRPIRPRQNMMEQRMRADQDALRREEEAKALKEREALERAEAEARALAEAKAAEEAKKLALDGKASQENAASEKKGQTPSQEIAAPVKREERGEKPARNERQGRRDGGDNRGQDNRGQGRNQNDRRDNRGDNRSNGRSGERGPKRENAQGSRNDSRGDRFSNGDRQGNRQGRASDRPERKNDRRGAAPAPMMENQKPQRGKNKGKDDYKKKNDYRRDNMDDDRMPKGKRGKGNGPKAEFTKPQAKPKVEEQIKSITIPETLTISDLAEKMKVNASQIVKKLFMQGMMVTVNQEIDYATAEEIALEYEILCEKEEVVDVIEELLKEEEEDESKMVKRSPVVCVMGHVDHGKTSLLDAIRDTNVIGGEAGGITQHIGASVVEINGQKITFLDTPGHEAFTSMRMRGANSTDIAVLVVAADDGVMPQTIEAINHAKAAGVEIIVAVNKIDKPAANVERVKQEMTEYELIPEDWGGSTIFVPVSAKTGEGIEDLLEMILLSAEVLELKANKNRRARGLVLEAQLDKGRGPVATVLVQKGTLRVGDPVAAGSSFGKVRAMVDDKGRRVKEAGPSTPVEILGLNDVPNAGEVFVECANEKDARSFADTFIAKQREDLLTETKSKVSLDELFNQIQEGNLKELNIVVKADVQGSVEAVKQSLLKLSNDEVVVKIIHGAVGAVNESDVTLASASNAIIIGFNVRPDAMAKESAEREGVDIRLYRVIYNAIEDVQAAMKGMLDPIFEEKVLGHAEVRQTFKASGVGTIAGSYVLDGTFERDCSVRLTRDGIIVFEGPLASLRRFKDDVKEVRAGYECGFVFANYNDIKEGDMVESFKMVEIPR